MTTSFDDARRASITRHTNETDIDVRLNLDGSGQADLSTGIGFFDHMLEQVARHGLLDLYVCCQGDLHVDGHHSIEDVGIAIGQALRQAVGDARGICRYGHSYVPLDEALSRVVLDLSGRPGLVMHADFTASMVGQLDTQLVREFFQALANHAAITLHIDCLRGDNAHPQAETIFKAFGRALRMALTRDERAAGQVPSTKGVL